MNHVPQNITLLLLVPVEMLMDGTVLIAAAVTATAAGGQDPFIFS